ncbi:MAG: helix-turn-helix transcriptional regulator [Rhodospirillaceae bacterium]|nr:helix-turn-helix transcriptional regulator [Rhodospirillaceae bacterium]
MSPNKIANTSSVDASLREVGERLSKIRLSRNLTQASLAQDAGASVSSIKRLEAGENVSLDTFVRVLMALDLTEHLSAFLPDPEVRPIERVKRAGHERQRARGAVSVTKATDWAWGEDDEA